MARYTDQNLTYNSFGSSQVWTKYRVHLLTTLLLVLVIISIPRPDVTIGLKSLASSQLSWTSPRNQAANSTLGFQKLLALSKQPSWRTRGLQAAADLVGLDFTIPPQPRNPPELIAAFEQIGREEGKKTPAHGSATAWFAHIDLLKYVIASDLETAFIVEDDVDFDVRLKSQVQLISDNVRNYTMTPGTDTTPYGTNWDVLWLGHCGSLIQDDMSVLKYKDETRCKTELYSGWSKRFLREKLEEDYRYLQNSALTVCTFGYGVTRKSAQKILSLLAKGGDEAYDVSMAAYCRSGELDCIVVNPQIFNHYEPRKDSGYLSPVHVGDGQGEAADELAFESEMGTTGNIMHSARCKALFNDVCMRPPSEL